MHQCVASIEEAFTLPAVMPRPNAMTLRGTEGGRDLGREGGKDVCAGTNPASCIALGGHTEGTGRDGTDEGFSQFSIRRATTTQSGVNKIMLGSGNGQLNYCVAVSF